MPSAFESVLSGSKTQEAARQQGDVLGELARQYAGEQAQLGGQARGLAAQQTAEVAPFRTPWLQQLYNFAATEGQVLPFRMEAPEQTPLPSYAPGVTRGGTAGYQEAMQRLLTTGQLAPGTEQGPTAYNRLPVAQAGIAQAGAAQAPGSAAAQYTPPTFDAYSTATREATENAFQQARQQTIEGADVRGGQLGTALTNTSIARGSQLASNAERLAALQNQYGQQNAQFAANLSLQNIGQANQVNLANAQMGNQVNLANMSQANQVALANAGMANQYGVGQEQFAATMEARRQMANQSAAMAQYGTAAQQTQQDIAGMNQFAQQRAQFQQLQENARVAAINEQRQRIYSQMSGVAQTAPTNQIQALLSSAGLLNPVGFANAGTGAYNASTGSKNAKTQAISSYGAMAAAA